MDRVHGTFNSCVLKHALQLIIWTEVMTDLGMKTCITIKWTETMTDLRVMLETYLIIN